MEKICKTCDVSKPLSSFSKNKTKKDGFNSECKDCRKVYIREHYKKNKGYYKKKSKERASDIRKWLRSIKSDLCCQTCGENHPACLEYHHKDPKQKDFEISKAGSSGISKTRILEEIEKCIVLCSNCHKKLHWNTQTGLFGTKTYKIFKQSEASRVEHEKT